MSAPRPEISVVIPAHNRAGLLIRLLDSIAASEAAPPWEVIVVDDASTDDTGEAVARWQAAHPAIACHYVRLSENLGPGNARNRGVEAARASCVAFTDTDCVVSPQWLAALWNALGADPALGGAGGPVSAYNPESVFALYNIVNATLVPIRYDDFPIPYLITCNCCYRRELLQGAGGFTADIGTPGGEDVAASIALYKQGYRFAYADDALVQHDFRDTWRSFIRTWTNYGYGCGLVTHRLLTPEERHPEWNRRAADNYWGIHTVRPTVTGIRSFFKDLRWFWGECGRAEIPTHRRPRLLVLRVVERLCYLRGWKRGTRQAARERVDGNHRT